MAEEKSFPNNLKDVLSGYDTDHEAFWTALEGNYSTAFVNQYFAGLIEVLTVSKRKSILRIEEKMYATLLALWYFKNARINNLNLISNCQKFIQNNHLSHGRWILELATSSSNQSFACGFMTRLVLAPNSIIWNNNVEVQMQLEKKQNDQYLQRKDEKLNVDNSFMKIKNLSFHQVQNVEMNSISLGYLCFLHYVKSNGNQLKQNEYRHMVNLLKAIMNLAKSDQQSVNIVCSFIHFIMAVITFCSCPYQEIRKELFYLSYHLRNFFGMIGEMGSQLFNLMEKQIKIPGASFRRKLRSDFPSLDIKESTEQNDDVFIVTELQDTFKSPKQYSYSLTNLRKLLIWQIVKLANLPEEEFNGFMEAIKQLNNAQTYQLYFKCSKIVDLSCQMQVFSKIQPTMRNSILTLAKEAIHKFIGDRKRIVNAEMQEFEKLISQSINTFNPQYPTYKIKNIKIKDFSGELLENGRIWNKIKKEQNIMVLYRACTSIVFYGKTGNFIQFVKEISQFLEKATIEEAKDLKVYYICKSDLSQKSEIGSYIASKDVWYRRFVHNVFKGEMIYPFLDINTRTKKELFPAKFMRESLQMYLRQAKRICPLKVYKCFLTIKDVAEEKQIYFTSSVAFGIFAEGENIRNMKEKIKSKQEKYKNKDLVEIINEKVKKTNVWMGDLEINWIQPITNAIIQQTHKGVKLEDFQVVNMPKDYFFGDLPDPSGKGLKLALLPQSKSKIFWKELMNNENFKQNKKAEEVGLAFKDIFITRTIKSLRFENKAQEFLKVLVDGVPHTKVQSIEIVSPVTYDKFPLAIPICTFLPFK